jgi:phosphoserine phosphatase
MDSLYVIYALGKDKPGLVHSVTNILAGLDINIVDVEARAVRGHFLLFLVVDLGAALCTYEDLILALEPVGSDFDLGLRVEPFRAGLRNPEKHLLVVTIMGIDRPGVVASISGLFSENDINIESIRMIARGDYIAMELTVDASNLADLSGLRKILYRYSEDTGLDVSLQDEDIFQRPKRVVIFDCDSTIIQEEVIDELAKAAGVGSAVEEMTVRAMDGRLDFNDALRERVRLLKGFPLDKLESIKSTVNLTPGAEELVSTLHYMGYKVGVISGGFSFFTDYLKKRLKLDYVYANELEIDNGVLTGEITGEIIDAERKGEIIKQIAARERISVDQIVAVGDGSNDRFMLKNAGLAIAFNPKEILKEYSDGVITGRNLSGLLYFLGIPDSKSRSTL